MKRATYEQIRWSERVAATLHPDDRDAYWSHVQGVVRGTERPSTETEARAASTAGRNEHTDLSCGHPQCKSKFFNLMLGGWPIQGMDTPGPGECKLCGRQRPDLPDGKSSGWFPVASPHGLRGHRAKMCWVRTSSGQLDACIASAPTGWNVEQRVQGPFTILTATDDIPD